MYPFKAILVGQEIAVAPIRPLLATDTVEIEATFSDASAAIPWLLQAPEARRLFVMHVADPEHLEEVKRLRGCCVGQPILALTPSGKSDSNALIQLMRAGVDQAVVLPAQAAEFHSALDSLAWQFGFPAGRSNVIAVVGVAPGCGISAIAANLAYEVAHRGRDCLLVEASHRLGKLASKLGVTPRFTTRDILAAQDRLDVTMVKQALIPLADRLRLLAAAADEIYHQNVTPERIRSLMTLFRQVAEISILRIPHNVNDAYFAALAAADQVVMVAQYTPDSLHDLKLLCQTMQRDFGTRTLYPVINRYDERKRETSLEQLQEALEVPRVLTVAEDQALADSTDHLVVLRQKNLSGPALQDLQVLACLLLHEPEPPSAVRSRLFGWLKRVFPGG
jgi:Flp pilus assembly CpaE family ATPase